MHKINTNTATSSNEFTDGDAAQAIAATDLNAAWFNSVQREICNLITKLGGTLSDSYDDQAFKAIEKIGIKFEHVDGNSYTAPSDWLGSVVLNFNATNFTLSGNFVEGCFVAICPIWSDSNSDSFTVTGAGLNVTLYKGQGIVAYCKNGNLNAGFKIVVPNGGRIYTSYIEYKHQIDKDIVELGDYGNGHYLDWAKGESWVIGQVKRVTFQNAVNDYNVRTFYTDDKGTLKQFTIFKEGFREFLCVGKCSVNGTQYAVLAINGNRIQQNPNA